MLTDRDMSDLRIAVSGSRGMVGRAICDFYQRNGAEVIALVRDSGKPGREAQQDVDELAIWQSNADLSRLEGLDAVIHLAGSPIAEKRWTDKVKREIYKSRVPRTSELCEKLASLTRPPRCLLCASAIGFYGDRGEEVLTESSSAGDGFLAEVVTDWEAACEPARSAGIRVVSNRFGMILSESGGALAKMLPLFRLGLGGRLGSGQQWWSWVGLDDVVSVFDYEMRTETLLGVVNVTSPESLRNQEFTDRLAGALRRPAWIPAPELALRIALGEMSTMLLSSTKVVPQRLLQAGFTFTQLNFADCLGRPVS